MNSKKAVWLAVLLAIYFTLVTAWFVLRRPSDLPKNSAEWQAVFLADGQVYFGRLENYNRKFAVLGDVYYLKFGSAIQQSQGAASSSASGSGLNLIRLGGEVHGPQNQMFIAKDKILFIENLKNDSSVVKAIRGLQSR